MYWLFLVLPTLFGIYLLYEIKPLNLSSKIITFITWPIVSFASLLIVYLTFVYISADVEYHGGWVKSVTWEEHWTEHQTYYTTDDKGNVETYDTYIYHPDNYYIKDSNGYNVAVTSRHWDYFVEFFGNKTEISSSHIGQSSIFDGREFITHYSGELDKFTPCFTKHLYENRILYSNSIFKSRKVDAKKSSLYDYPLINLYKQESLLGSSDILLRDKLTWFNAKYGQEKEIRLFVLLFNGDIEQGELQQNYWQNGNKNEVVVCLGLDSMQKIKWVYPFGWGNEKLLVDLREDISGLTFDMNTLKLLMGIVKDGYKRIDWHQFDYLPMYFPWYIHIIGWGLSTISCLIIFYWERILYVVSNFIGR